MDHDQAIQTQASMRYVLDELTPAERDLFEEHYADCSVCMSDVELATVFAANAKEVFHERALAGERPKGSRWLAWRPFPALALSTALNLILVASVGYGVLRSHWLEPMHSSNIRQLESPDIVPVHGTTRGSEGSGQVVRASMRPLLLTFDLPQRYDHYYYSIDRAGTAVLSGELAASDQAESASLPISAADLKPGQYHVTVTGSIGAVRENLVDCRLEVAPR